MRDDVRPFTPIWSKYRPVILQLMTAASGAPQQYQLYAHEFKALSKKDKVSFSFLLEAQNGKALNNIKTSPVAQDLLFVLQQSKTAVQLLREAVYEFSMDKQFILRINKKEAAPVISE